MLAVREFAEDDLDSPDDPLEEPPVELDFESDVELDFSEPDLSDVDLLSAPVWGLSEEPDSVGGAARLSVR